MKSNCLPTHNELAEQAGANQMLAALKAMQRAPAQGKRLAILSRALRRITADSNPRVLVGATVAMIALLDRGLEGVEL